MKYGGTNARIVTASGPALSATVSFINTLIVEVK